MNNKIRSDSWWLKPRWGLRSLPCLAIMSLVIAAFLVVGCQPLQATLPTPSTSTATFTPTPVPAATPTVGPKTFDGKQAWQDVNYQVNLGPRIPGTQAHQQIIDWMVAELKKAGWAAELQNGTALGHAFQNVVAKRGTGEPWLILGAHYDTRMFADQDPDPAKRTQPVPGANDGASGVSVLLELARILPENLKSQVWLVFFDVEDQGDIPGWDWILGSTFFANSLTSSPDAVVVIDMIGDANLDIYKERNSSPALVESIWNDAAKAGYSRQFIPQLKFSMLDDHTPFLQRGYQAADLIDFNYPAWHTTADTPDKVSPESLKAVGDTLLLWIESH
jgi:glutaminyl-peptide cyclotransferase